VYTEWNQGAENRASRPMAGQIRRNPPGLPRVPRLGSRSYLPGQPDLELREGSVSGGLFRSSIDQIGVLTVGNVKTATMRDVRCRDRMEPSCREPGIQTHGGQIRRNPPGLPRVPRLGPRSYLPGQPSQIGGSRIERGQSAGGYSDPSIDQIGV